jgi:hypothetical protein
MFPNDIIRWLQSLAGENSTVAIDDDGLRLIALNAAGQPTGAFLEIGGNDPNPHASRITHQHP